MLCTFCGTENRPENKFCGMCGVRMERRQAHRRNQLETLKCESCGHVNELGHRFCGECGTRVERRLKERRAGVAEQPRASAIANVQLPSPETPVRPSEVAPSHKPEDARASAQETASPSRTSPAIFRSETPRVPSIGGPSFLGLGEEPPNSDYLLEEERSSGSMLRRLVLIAILAAIAGLVFVGWRSTFFRANPKPAPTPAASPSPSPASSPGPQGPGQDPPPDPDQSTKNPTAPQRSAAADSPSDAKDAPAPDPPDPSTKPSVDDREKAAAASRGKRTSAANKAADGLSSEAQRRPSAALLRAQQYLQGRGGVKQNCEQGLMYLKAATDKNEPAAAVQMGALYASGHCVQRNEVTAYRWFNSAHELEPANPWIQANLERLWERMTPQQRRQAGQ